MESYWGNARVAMYRERQQTKRECERACERERTRLDKALLVALRSSTSPTALRQVLKDRRTAQGPQARCNCQPDDSLLYLDRYEAEEEE